MRRCINRKWMWEGGRACIDTGSSCWFEEVVEEVESMVAKLAVALVLAQKWMADME